MAGKLNIGSDLQAIIDAANIASSSKTFTLPNATGTFVLQDSTDTLTNKTFDANGTGNTLSNVEVADFAAAAIVTEAEGISSNDNDTTIPTSAAVKDYVDNAGGSADGEGHGAGVVWVPAGEMYSDGGAPIVGNPVMARLVNSGVTDMYASAFVPVGYTSISSILVYYISRTTGNLYLKFSTQKWSTAATVQSDATDTLTTYAAGATSLQVYTITVPSGAYDGLTGISAGMSIALTIERDADNASDTYEQVFDVIGVKFTFA